MKYTDLPETEQPRRRLRDLGGPSLSTSELLSVALWIADSEAANELAAAYHEAGNLGRIDRNRITGIRGLGERYADALAAVHELTRREVLSSLPDRPAVHCPADAAVLVQYEMAALEQEQLRIILLDTRNHVIRTITLYQGSTNSSQVRVAEVFKAAVRENAVNIIVCHNHPSGDPTPSPEDVALTRSIVQAGKLMDIEVMDHLVIGAGRFVSLKERGLAF
jgi:DNA repair protein RadC